KLAKPALFKVMFEKGWKQFVPFIVTIIGIVFTNLLLGIMFGLAVSALIVIVKSFQNSHFLHLEDKSNGTSRIKMTLAEEVTFFNKGAILKELDNLPNNTFLELDVRNTVYIDDDIVEILEDFLDKSKDRKINIRVNWSKGVMDNPESFYQFFQTIK
ncbi:MAG: SulP family inorganic anion transporter, partial [Schleiferiaceae bacterium]|nr:SulP family inorganic anion transporter [Schleiferiaceae bacterium]